MHSYEEIEISRDCAAIQIPDGIAITLKAGTPAVITQSLGDTYTVQTPTLGGLYRISGKDADAIGKAVAKPGGGADIDPSKPVDEELVWNQLRNVYDPEIPVNIVELGLIYSLDIQHVEEGGSTVAIQMTLTAPGCGMGDVIAADARLRIESVPGINEATVEVVFDPPWNQEMMSEAAKLELGLL